VHFDYLIGGRVDGGGEGCWQGAHGGQKDYVMADGDVVQSAFGNT